jgi:hypothetical protein
MPSSLTIRIADVCLAASVLQDDLQLEASHPDVRFLVDGATPDFEFEVLVGQIEDLSSAPLLFRGRVVWELRQVPGGSVLLFGGDRYTPHDRSLFIPDTPVPGRLTVAPHSPCLEAVPGGVLRMDPFVFPATELVLYWHLAKHGGIFVHGSGVDYRGAGRLFCGVSGVGKSTMARLALSDGGTVLNDDRIGITRGPEGFVLHGTPWHGTAEYHRPARAPLGSVYFLEHGATNEVRRLTDAEAFARVAAAACPPCFSHDLMEGVVETYEALVSSVPCYHLKFLPDLSVLEAIADTLSE